MRLTLETSQGNIPQRGGVHPEYLIYLGGEDLDDNWDLQPGYHLKYVMQCRNPMAVVLMIKTLKEPKHLCMHSHFFIIMERMSQNV